MHEGPRFWRGWMNEEGRMRSGAGRVPRPKREGERSLESSNFSCWEEGSVPSSHPTQASLLAIPENMNI